MLVGFPPFVVVTLLAADLRYQFFLHTEAIGRLGPIEWVFNTPAHHRLHHGSNAAYIDRNFGGVLIVFDRLFGTLGDERPDEPIHYGLAHRVAAEIGVHEASWPQGLPRGVIHADLFPNNVFFLGDRLSGLIDFYFACTDAFAYDLAICLNSWCFEADSSFNLTKGQALLAGYESVRPLEAAEVEALPQLCRGSALRFLLTRLVDWLNVPPGALVKPHDPLEYDRKLVFHQRVADAREYGLKR